VSSIELTFVTLRTSAFSSLFSKKCNAKAAKKKYKRHYALRLCETWRPAYGQAGLREI
jgi:hypothetical protein